MVCGLVGGAYLCYTRRLALGRVTVGYNANGYVAITCTDPTQLTAMALAYEGLARDLTADYHAETILQEMQSHEGDVLLRALAASRFSDGAMQERDGNWVYTAFYDDKWWEGADFVHRLAAASGMTVKGEFRGEDDAEWAWASHSGNFIEDEIIHVLGTEHAALMLMKEALTELSGLVAGSGGLSDADVARVREIVAPYASAAQTDDESAVLS